MKSRDFIDAVVSEIQQHGVSDWSVDYGHNHPRIIFAWDGRVITHVVPGTPSARSGVLNNITELRQKMGVKRIIAPKSATPAKKRPAKQTVVTALPELSGTVMANPWRVLEKVQVSIHAGIDEAWALGRAAFHAGMCGVAPADFAPHLAKAFVKGWAKGMWDR